MPCTRVITWFHRNASSPTGYTRYQVNFMEMLPCLDARASDETSCGTRQTSGISVLKLHIPDSADDITFRVDTASTLRTHFASAASYENYCLFFQSLKYNEEALSLNFVPCTLSHITRNLLLTNCSHLSILIAVSSQIMTASINGCFLIIHP